MEVVLEKGVNAERVRNSLRRLGFQADEVGEVRQKGRKRVITVPIPHQASIGVIRGLPGIVSVRRKGSRQTACPFLDG